MSVCLCACVCGTVVDSCYTTLLSQQTKQIIHLVYIICTFAFEQQRQQQQSHQKKEERKKD